MDQDFHSFLYNSPLCFLHYCYFFISQLMMKTWASIYASQYFFRPFASSAIIRPVPIYLVAVPSFSHFHALLFPLWKFETKPNFGGTDLWTIPYHHSQQKSCSKFVQNSKLQKIYKRVRSISLVFLLFLTDVKALEQSLTVVILFFPSYLLVQIFFRSGFCFLKCQKVDDGDVMCVALDLQMFQKY